MQFIVEDLEEEWVYPEDFFDYVHIPKSRPLANHGAYNAVSD